MGGAALLGGFLGGVTEGVTQHFVDKKADKKLLSDEERQAKYDQLSTGIQGAQTKLATLAPGSPEYAQTMDDITQGHSQLTDLFHPSTGPGALAHLGRIVSEKWLHKPAPTETEVSRAAPVPAMNVPTGGGSFTSPDLPGAPGTTVPGMAGPSVNLPAQAGPQIAHPVPIATAGEAKQKSAEFMTRLGMEGTPAPEAANQFANYRSQLKQAIPSMSEQDLDQAVRIHAGVDARPLADKAETWKPLGKPFASEGGFFQTYQNARGETKRQAMPEGYVQTAAATHESTAELARLTKAMYGDHPTAAQMLEAARKLKAAQTPTTSTLHETIQFDPETGQGHLVTEKSTRELGNPKLKDSGRVGPALDGVGKSTPAQVAADKAVKLAQASYLDVQKASKDPTPVGDQGVILAWLRGRVNRVTATEIAAVSNLGGAQLKLEGNVARIVSGKMTDQQRQWFLRSAKDNYESAQTVATRPGGGGGGDEMVNATIPGVGTKPIHRSQVAAFKAKYPNGTVADGAR